MAKEDKAELGAGTERTEGVIAASGSWAREGPDGHQGGTGATGKEGGVFRTAGPRLSGMKIPPLFVCGGTFLH